MSEPGLTWGPAESSRLAATVHPSHSGRGLVAVDHDRPIDMGGAHPTPRMMGRFAMELYEGPTLIERVRFDFPMLGGGETPEQEEDPASPAREPIPRPSGGLSERQAEQILNSAARDEQEVQGRKQRTNQPETPPRGKDW